MARPREFEIDEAVERAMEVFWKHGYAETSLPDLLDGMGLSRGSFYKAFGSKKAAFLMALERYQENVVAPAVTLLRDSNHSGADRIRTVFERALTATAEGDRRGCLLCTSAAGAAQLDDEIAERVNRQLDQLTEGFRIAAEDAGHAAPDRAAAGLTLAYVGLRVRSRGRAQTEDLKKAAHHAVESALSA